MNTWITVLGFCLGVAGVDLICGHGFALLMGGLVLFIAGGLASVGERRL